MSISSDFCYYYYNIIITSLRPSAGVLEKINEKKYCKITVILMATDPGGSPQ